MSRHILHIHKSLSRKIKGKATIYAIPIRKLKVGNEEEHTDCGDKMWLNDKNSTEEAMRWLLTWVE